MNVLFLSELFSYPRGSGGQLATYLYAKLLSEAGFDIKVVTNRFSGEPEKSENGKLAVYRLPLLRNTASIKYSILQRFDVLFSAFMRRLIRWADVVYVPVYWYSAVPLAKAYGKPVVIHLHGYTPICPLSTLYDLSKDTICNRDSQICSARCIYDFEKERGRGSIETLASVILNSTLGHYLGKLAMLSDAIICVSEAQSSLISTRVPSLRRKIRVVYNPLPELQHVEIEGSDFGYFGGPSPLKGFQTLCHALACINDEKTRVHATNFPNPRGDLVKSLSRSGISVYQRLPPPPWKKIYRRIRAVLVPSMCPEPLPYVVSEAILRGRIVVASRVGGIPEQVEGCEGSFLLHPGNYERLAEIIDLIRGLNRESVTDLGFQNREAFLKKFDNVKILKNFVDVLTKASNAR